MAEFINEIKWDAQDQKIEPVAVSETLEEGDDLRLKRDGANWGTNGFSKIEIFTQNPCPPNPPATPTWTYAPPAHTGGGEGPAVTFDHQSSAAPLFSVTPTYVSTSPSSTACSQIEIKNVDGSNDSQHTLWWKVTMTNGATLDPQLVVKPGTG